MLTIPEFCERNKISRSLYYSLKRSGKGPAETHIGARVLISEDTAAAWLKGLEKASTAPVIAESERRPRAAM